MANRYDTNLKLEEIVDALGDISEAIEQGGGGGGGGTTVIANPTGTPTDDLDTIQIGSTIYNIPGSGGGGGAGYTNELIYSSPTPVNSGTLSLTKNITDFDVICFAYGLVGNYGKGDNSISFKYVDVNYFMTKFPNTATRVTDHMIIDGYSNFYVYAKMGPTIDSIDIWNVGSPNTGVLSVYGIKYGTGGGGGSSKQVDLLYTNPNRTIENTVTLNNPYTDYDFIVMIIADIAQHKCRMQSMFILKETMDESLNSGNPISFYQSAQAFLEYIVTDSVTLTEDAAAYECITKIYGVKL